jgi:hypothetical protein
VFSSFLEYRTTDKSKNPVIPSVIHYRQNPLESNAFSVNICGCLAKIQNNYPSPKVNEPLVFREKVNSLIYLDTKITLKLLILSLQFYAGLARTSVSPAVGLDDATFMNYITVVLT